jgi:hypothetical protein
MTSRHALSPRGWVRIVSACVRKNQTSAIYSGKMAGRGRQVDGRGGRGGGGGVNIHYAALAQLDSLGGDTHNNGALALDEVGNGVAHHRLRDRPRADLARGHARERVHRRHADSGLLARPSADLEEAPHAVTVLTIAGQHQVVLQVPPQLAVVPPERVGADVDRAEQPFAIRQGACTKIRW